MMVHDRDIRLALSIVRSRLIERIAFASTQRIALILAPAGYGKSVALRQFLETLDEPFVRYDVRAEHASLLGFVRGLADALLDIAPDARKTVAGAEERSRSSKTPGADLAIWMRAHLEDFSGVIAIDDLHAAERDPQVSAFLASLVERTKPRVRWILASRSSLGLPVGSWLAYGEMDLPIDEDDLRFTPEEAQQAAGGAPSLSPAEVQEIVSLTEGWPAAVSFALRTSARSADLRSIAATTREMTYRYLAEQVYRALTEAERDLLHFAALLPEISVGLVRHAGYTDARAALEALSVRVAFIHRDGPIYRCHDLFRDFLRHELELRGDAAVAAMHRRVAGALEVSGDVAQAIVHFAHGACEADVLRMLRTSGFDLMEHAHADAVQVAIDSLSDEIRTSDAVVLGMRGLQEAHSGRFDRAESLLRRAIDRSGDDTLKATLSIRLALVLINQQRDATGLLEPLRELPLARAMQGEILSLLAVAYTSFGRPDDARELFAQVEEVLAQIDEDSVRAKILQRMGVVGSQTGFPPDTVAEHLVRSAEIALHQGMFALAGRAYGALANFAVFREDDVDKSARYAKSGIDSASKAGDHIGLQTCLLQLMQAEAKYGNAANLRLLERKFTETATTDSVMMAHILPARSILLAWDGRFEEAHRQLCSAAERIGFLWDREYNAALCALYLTAAGDCERERQTVERIVRDLHNAVPAPNAFGRRMRSFAWLICAYAEAFCGRITSASRILRSVAATDDPGTQAMQAIVNAALRALKSPAFRPELEASFDKLDSAGYSGLRRLLSGAVQHRIMDEPAPPLTAAEVSVLKALAEGHSPKDIARETGRSALTIQAHVQNVIRKFGCSGRTEALAIARRRGLLK